MAVKIAKVSSDQTPVGRRLFSQAAPMIGQAVGSIYGGPAGGMAGSKVGGMIGDKVGGSKANLADFQVEGHASAPAPMSQGPATSAGGQLHDSPFARRMDAKQQDPEIAIHEGLNALSAMPDEVKQEYAPPLIQAQMALEKKRRGY